MRVCNCGETLSASDQRKAAEIKAATRARPQVWKRAKLFIAARACDSGARRASNFWECTRPRVPFVANFPRRMGTQRIAFTRRPARAPIAVREARALPGLNALHHSLLFSVAVTLR